MKINSNKTSTISQSINFTHHPSKDIARLNAATNSNVRLNPKTLILPLIESINRTALKVKIPFRRQRENRYQPWQP